MKICLISILLFICSFSSLYSAKVNNVIVTIGNNAITSFDLSKTRDFYQVTGSDTSKDPNFAFKDLLFTYSLLYLSTKDSQLNIKQEEIDKFVDSITNIQNTKDNIAENRLKVYQMFPDQFKLLNKKNQIIRGMMFYYEDLKAKANEAVADNLVKDFYNKNKNRPPIMETPMLDFIVVAVVAPDNLGLSETEKFEENLKNIANQLKKSDDIDAILSQYKFIHFESYTGRCGYKPTDALYQLGYPQEALSIALMDTIKLQTGPFIMKEGSVFGPQAIVMQKTNKKTYLMVKLISRQPAKIRTLENAKPDIENILKQDRMYQIFQDYVVNKIKNGEINVILVDKNYEGAYNEFIRR